MYKTDFRPETVIQFYTLNIITTNETECFSGYIFVNYLLLFMLQVGRHGQD